MDQGQRCQPPDDDGLCAQGHNTGAAVLVFPGGGYQVLAMDLEGTEICDWLTARGITCVLLRYRVPNSGPTSVNDRRCYPKVQTACRMPNER